MRIQNSIIVVTGAASGIGKALADRFEAEGAKTVVRADINVGDPGSGDPGSGDVREPSIRYLDVSDADAVEALVRNVVDEFGRLDLYCSNAGIGTGMGIDATDDLWHRMFDVNVMGTVNAARAFLPVVRSQGRGHLLVTASAAGLLTNLGDAAYSATKHAAVGLAEWLSITHADEGLTVSCLCPQGVNTPLVTGGIGGPGGATLATDVVKLMGLIEPDDVADAVVEGLAEDRFLILPHPEVADYVRTKADNVDRWLDAMRKLQRRLLAT
ncbi:MAG: SDR family oxidoreductase [Microthrixaceae bacterium]